MSENSIARWNAIPMERPEVNGSTYALKSTRDDEGDEDSDDNVSLVSRSPSPPPNDDKMAIDKYDEYARGVQREVITIDTKINKTNKGFAMLAKLGWVEGQPLGISGNGRVDPVPFVIKNDLTGLGKTTQDVRMIESTVSQRRELDSERMTRETEDERKAREESVAKRIAVQSEISTVLRPFYCELCDKQFKNVAQYDEHTNSYAHHHKARFRDMQAAQRVTFSTTLDKRKEKERKREEKELRKLAKAAGIKMSKPPTSASMHASVPPTAVESSSEPDEQLSGSKKGGWATIGPSSMTALQPESSSPTGSAGGQTTQPSRSGWANVSQPTSPPPPSSTQSGPPPAFRTGGWTSLDTGSTQAPAPVPVPPPASAPVPVPAPPPPSETAPLPPVPTRSARSTVSTPVQTNASSDPAPTRGGWQGTSTPAPTAPLTLSPPSHAGTASPTQPPAEPRKSVPTKRAEASRSGWQQFKAGGARRR